MNQQARVNKGVNWWKRAVFYQIYPRSFKDSNNDGFGDIPGIISKLDYLNDGTPQSLGIDAIWFSPFFTSPDLDFGYDIEDYCAIDPRYGTMEDFNCLLEEAHRRNIMVMLDLVVNHTSSSHSWFRESRSGWQNPKRNWYIWKDGRAGGKKPPNNWRNNFFGPAWSKDESTGQYYLHSFLNEQPDLNWANREVRDEIGQVIRFWLERGVDGFRLDVAHIYCKDQQFRDNPPFFYPRKKSGSGSCFDRTWQANFFRFFSLPEFQVRRYNQHQPETHHVLKEFRCIFNQYPAKTSVGEIIGDHPGQIAAYYGENNDQLHMNFYFELLHCRFKAGAFRRCIDRWEDVLPKQAWPAYTLSNHDLKRAISRYGNNEARARLLLMMLLTLRGTPFIYYGEEIGLREAKLPKAELKDPVGKKWYPFHPGRDGCRTPMPWNNEPFGGFSTNQPWLPLSMSPARCNVEQQNSGEDSLLAFTRRLIWLRKGQTALLEGSYRSLTEGIPADCFAYIREDDPRNRLLILLNFSLRLLKVEMPGLGKAGELLLSTEPQREPGWINAPIKLSPFEGVLIKLQAI